MNKTRSRGFTLIELLVVIAIIGILSAVILAALSTARGKGDDAAVQSNLSTIQTEAEIYYSGLGGNSYGTDATTCGTGMFSADSTIVNAISSAKNDAVSATVACASASTAGTATSYAVIGQINGTTTPTEWCVDSTGVAKYEYIASPSVTTLTTALTATTGVAKCP